MNTFKITGIIFALLFGTILLIGFISESESTITAEIVIDAPQPVVLRILRDSSIYSTWSPYVRKVIDSDRETRLAYYQIGERQFVLKEHVRLDYDENCVCFESLDSLKHAYLYHINQLFALRSLPDGSSEVRYKLTYRTYSILTRFFNSLFIKRKISGMVEDNLLALKAYIQG
ncbi:MAG TPA: hypothetical protein EYP36_04085 [Calditrichaeota bacterium]|nr:hypothetical protein [Calditrichota bacterium]